MLHFLLPIHVVAAVENHFGSIPAELQEDLEQLLEPEDLQSLLFDIDKCESLEDFARRTHWMVGKQAGRLDGLRDAVDIALGPRDDHLTEQISDQACGSCDRNELEELLERALQLTRAPAKERPVLSPLGVG